MCLRYATYVDTPLHAPVKQYIATPYSAMKHVMSMNWGAYCMYAIYACEGYPQVITEAISKTASVVKLAISAMRRLPGGSNRALEKP